MQVGDEVTWTHTKKINGGYSFTNCKGKVLKIDGNLVSIRYKGREVRLRISEINGYEGVHYIKENKVVGGST